MAEDIGANFSPYQGLEFISAASPEELHATLKGIRIQFRILSIYAQGAKHIAWIDTGAIKIKKVTKKKE